MVESERLLLVSLGNGLYAIPIAAVEKILPALDALSSAVGEQDV
jgi:hypothetical protein